jgi:hypothetical protein
MYKPSEVESDRGYANMGLPIFFFKIDEQYYNGSYIIVLYNVRQIM